MILNSSHFYLSGSHNSGDGFLSSSGVFKFVGGLFRGVRCYNSICDRFGIVVLGGTPFLRGSAIAAWIGVCCHRFLLVSQAVFDRFSIVNNYFFVGNKNLADLRTDQCWLQ